MQNHNGRVGLVLFGVYVILYVGFVLLNAFAPEVMEITPLAGVNLAVLYGFGLIVAAVMVAIIYGWISKYNEVQPNKEDQQ